jgi:HSP20 family protein
VVCGDPIRRKSLPCSGNVDLSVTNHVAHQPLQPLFRLGIPCLFNASSWLWPEIGWVVRSTEAKWDKVIDLVVGVCTARQSVSPQNFVSPLSVHTTTGFLWPAHMQHRDLRSLLTRPPDIGAGTPAISVAETNNAFEVTAELPGVDEKDIKVSLDENQLVISGEKKAESTKEEKDWHVEERSYGSFYRSMLLPFEPEEGAVEAHLDKGVLHLTIAVKTTKTIDTKTGAPPSPSPASNKAAAPSKAAWYGRQTRRPN